VILGRRDALLGAAAALAGRRAVAQSASGNGSLQHLVMERFARAAGVKLNHIPYRGGAPAANDLIAGQVQHFFGNGMVPRPLCMTAPCAVAHTGRGRLAALPDVPPLSETLPGFETCE
jgi:tripartite-type tricarboxylate transporter receptor subunit TctC